MKASSSLLARFTTIMDVFEDISVCFSLDEVATKAGLPRSTTYRLLSQLTCLDWIGHDNAGYCLGQRAKMWREASAAAEFRHQLREVAAPALQHLHLNASAAVVHLGVFEGGEIIHLDKLGSAPQTACIPTRVGGRLPANRIALGVAVLSVLPIEVAARHLVLEACPSGVNATAIELEKVRRTRLSVRRDDHVPGWISLASPISAAAALGIVLPIGDYLDSHRALVVGAAAHVRQGISRLPAVAAVGSE